MKTSHAWMACGLVFCVAAVVSAQSPAPAELVQRLTSDDYRAREAALVQLAHVGAEAIPSLLAAAQAKDPELAWRANETLRVLSETIDDQRAAAVRKALLHASKADNAAAAALAKRLLAQWPIFRHHYAAMQLELLGAEIADGPLATPATEVLPGPGGFVPAGGVFFAGLLRDRPDAAIIAADFGLKEFAALDGALDIDEDIPVTDEESAELEKEVLLAGDLFKEIGRAAARLARGAKLVEEAADAVALEELIIPDIVDAEPAIEFGFVTPGVPAEAGSEAVVSAPLAAGSVRIGKSWRGGNTGLAHLTQLQNIHTVILLDAPLSDAALAYLLKMPALRRLQIERTRLSSAALVQFHQRRPEVVIATAGGAALGIVGVADARGLRIQEVTPESGARRAGLWENDIVTKVAGLPVKEPHDVALALYDRRPAQRVKVDYVRDGKPRLAEVVLGEREALPTTATPRYQAYPTLTPSFAFPH